MARSRQRRASTGTPIACRIVLDIDVLGALNDRLGHLAGDRVIGDVANTLREAGGEGAVYRYGEGVLPRRFRAGGGGRSLGPEELFERALSALRQAKAEGGDRTALCPDR